MTTRPLALAFTLAAAGTALAPGAARAGGFAVAEQSVTAGGTAGAGTARAGDPGAAWYNPAALADGAGWRVAAGLLAARPSLTARADDGSWQTENDARWSTPPHLLASWARGRFAAGLYAGVPFGSGVAWPADWSGRYEIVRTQLEVFRLAPFVAWRHGRVRVAGGLHIDRGRLRVNRKLDFVDAEGDVYVDLAGTGLGLDAALFVEAARDLNVGFTYKSRTRLGMSGGADFTAPDAFQQKTADQNARSELTLPDRLALGVAWRHGPVTVLADLELLLWSVHEELVIDFEREATPDATQRYDWRSTLAARAGVEWAFAPAWVGRAGLLFDPTPTREETIAPASPDSSRAGATVGLARAIGRGVSVDLFYEHLRLLGRDSENVDALAADYGGHAHLVGLGVRYHAR